MPIKDPLKTMTREQLIEARQRLYLAQDEIKSSIEVELNAKISTVLSRMETMQEIFERTLGPLASSVQEIEEIKRKINLTPEEVEKVYGLNAATLANKRAKAAGPRYIKDGGKILYPQREIQKYLGQREVLTNED